MLHEYLSILYILMKYYSFYESVAYMSKVKNQAVLYEPSIF
jgi:hypothetical protein